MYNLYKIEVHIEAEVNKSNEQFFFLYIFSTSISAKYAI